MAVTEEEAAWEGARAAGGTSQGGQVCDLGGALLPADDDLKQERTRGTKASR